MLEVDCSSKGAPQSRVVNTCKIRFKNGLSPWIVERDDCIADLTACSAKEIRCRWPPLQSERVEFISHSNCRGPVSWLPRDRKAKQEKQPLLAAQASLRDYRKFAFGLHAVEGSNDALIISDSFADHIVRIFLAHLRQNGIDLSLGLAP